LQYGLTAAPASQPRNALVGQTFALVIAQAIGQAENLDPWFQQSLATALAISVMVKLGVTHPPAGAAALLFSTGKFTWEQVAIMLMANVVAVVCAAFFNNLSDRRQYPTFWGLAFLHRQLLGGDDAEKKKKET
jgi:CBS-domain-containing membrane protein